MFQNRVMPSGNALWLLGRHSLSMGGNYSYTQLNIRDRRTGTGQISTQDFGNFAQGNIAAQNASFTTTTFLVGNANRYYRANQVGAYVQDKLQLFSNLSLTAGVRYDWDAGLTEKNGNIFNFNPSTYSFNPDCLTNGDDSPADCYPGNGIVIAGNNKQATAGASKTTLTGRQWGFGPRIGAAWQPKMFNDKLVVRAGTGIYYDRGENFAFFSPGYSIGQVTGGPFGVAQSPPFVNAVQCNPNGGSDPVDTPGATCAGTYSLSTPYGSGTSFKQPTAKRRI
jgi:outer membrane receptor protein involved in Fe transport